MANDDIIARFRLDIEGLNKDINKIKDKLGDVEKGAGKTAKNASKEFDQFGNAVNKLGQRLIAVFAVERIISFGKSVINVTAQMQKYQAVLTNTLGSSVKAQTELDKIAKFASKTPLTIAEITETFIKLTNRGVKPTISQLQAFGDLALSLGKDLSQVTEAVLDINNPERWKELGIQATTNGDKVTLAFRGVNKEVDRTVEGVTSAIVAFGQMEGVVGGMDKAAETLGGKISTLSDSYDELLRAIGNSGNVIANGFIDIMTKGLDRITERIDTMGAFMKEFGEDAQLTRDAEILVYFKELEKNIRGSKYEAEDLQDELIVMNEQLAQAGGVLREAEGRFKVASVVDPLNILGEKSNAAEQLFEARQEYNTLLEIYTKLEGVAQGRVSWEEAMGEIKKKNNEEDKKTNEVIKTRIEILEELIKKEERLRSFRIQEGKNYDDITKKVIKLKDELEELIFQELRAAQAVEGIPEMKTKPGKIPEKPSFDEIPRDIIDENQSRLDLESERIENEIKQKQKAEEDKLRFEEDAKKRSIQLYSDYQEYLNNLDQERLKEIEENGESQLRALQDQLNRGLISEEGYQRAKQAQIRETDLRVKEAQRKQAERAKAIGIIEATVSASLAVARAFKDYQYPYSLGIAALVGASAFLQVSNIQNTNIPQFEKGGYIKGKRHREGGVLIEAEGGEYMVNRQGTARHLEVIEAINNGYFDKLIYQDWVLPALEQQKKEFAKMKDKSFASNLADSLVVKAMIDEDRLINSDKNTRKILMSIDSKLGRNSYINKRYN